MDFTISITGFMLLSWLGAKGGQGSSASHGCGYFEQPTPIAEKELFRKFRSHHPCTKCKMQREDAGHAARGGGVKSSLGWTPGLFSSPDSYFPRICCDETQDIFTFTPILSARQCRQRLGQLCSGRLVPHRRIIPRPTNRTEYDQLDHLSCVGHQRLELLLALGVARHCSHESSRRTF